MVSWYAHKSIKCISLFYFISCFSHYGGDNVSLIYLFVDVHMYVGCGIKSIVYDTIDYILSSLPIIKTREQIGFLFVFVIFMYVLSLQLVFFGLLAYILPL